MKYGNYTAGACEIFEHGEVEDYTIIVLRRGGLIGEDARAESRSSDTFDVLVLEDEEVKAPTGEAIPTTAVAAEALEITTSM